MKQFIKLLQWETVVRRNSSLTIQGNSIVRQRWKIIGKPWHVEVYLQITTSLLATKQNVIRTSVRKESVTIKLVSAIACGHEELEEHGSQITIKATVPAPFKFRGGDI